ncbi:MAG: Fe-S cluster assembly protein SufD [Firmicutes bacterium ZCTH02-B6]|nr:MAG: Fe-S cluster assembly protein SufD [Firmicutes bacterium ZCTH02-B6]
MTTQTKLDQGWIAALSDRTGEPAWLRERRLAAWGRFTELPVPAYERTRLKESQFEDFAPAQGSGPVRSWDELPAALREQVGDPAGRALVVLANGRAVYRQLPEALPEGVVITDLATAVREHAVLVEPRLLVRGEQGLDNKVTALSGALHTGGLFVYVPKGVAVPVPVEYILWMDESGVAVGDVALIVTEARAEVTVLETAVSAPGVERSARFGLIDVFPGEDARVVCGNVQAFGQGVQSLVVRRVLPAPRSHVDWVAAEFGAELSVNEMDSRLDGRGSEVRALGVFFAGDRQHIDLEMRMIHTGRETASDILVRGVVRDQGRAVYGPYTLIKHDAKDSTGFQRGNTLVLDPQARAYSIPQLHVQEDEVQGAGHAATVGKVDPEQLFYLQSRGLTLQQARRLIVDGFFYPVTDHIPVEALKTRVMAMVERKMSA